MAYDIGAFEFVAGGGTATTTYTATLSLDALLFRSGITKTTSLNALLLKSGNLKTTSFDGLLFQSGEAKSTLLDGLLFKSGNLKTASLDGLLTNTKTKTTSLDAGLFKSGDTVTTSLDGVLSASTTTVTKTASVDALLKKTVNKLISLDATIQGSDVPGPIRPSSIIIKNTDGQVFGDQFRDAIEGIGVKAALSATATVALEWLLPYPTLPNGQLTLRLKAVSGATGGVRFNPKWASIGDAETVAGTLNAEGVTSYDYSATGTFRYSQITLDADTPSGGETLLMDLVFDSSGWTVSSTTVVIPELIWV